MNNRKSILLAIIMVFLTNSLYAQQHKSISDKGYKKQVIHTICMLIQNKYVIPEAAEKYAAEFKKKYTSSCYDSCTHAKAFAKTVTADLINITHDKHINFMVIESSAVGEKAESALHHPVRYHLLRAKENTGFFKLEWIENSIGYVDIRRLYSFDQAKDMIIAAMKLAAILSRGTRKDYIDLYFILKQKELMQLFEFASKKYPHHEAFPAYAVRALSYFEDAEYDPMPRMIKPVKWAEIKSFLDRQALDMGRERLELEKLWQ